MLADAAHIEAKQLPAVSRIEHQISKAMLADALLRAYHPDHPGRFGAKKFPGQMSVPGTE